MSLKDLCLLSLLMVARVSADKHRLCACISDQGLVGVQINDDATKAVVNAYDGRFVYAGGNWFSDELHGAPYSGPYWHAIEGTVNGAKDDGWVGGDEAHGLCKKQNCDSACFSGNLSTGRAVGQMMSASPPRQRRRISLVTLCNTIVDSGCWICKFKYSERLGKLLHT
ncbi:uncharacterized protein CLUP02_09615 [Colletotrichum lupini]|uniref:Uncharacterized protein n=1 Tax=Colletotrichum lupini TaxID=145971 RepID=A0A9Q8SV18_9PEZI|nr:uncharacterized protein CLUP02_09615 [Colletotrichum lupini]UQC84119.1 hypothetical protein CLUP02_09615 [Colletotrichum lupini]